MVNFVLRTEQIDLTVRLILTANLTAILGRFALIECKLGSGEIEDGAQHLKELVALIRKHNMEEKQVPLREPDLLMVITGGEYAYTRPDGVHVIPLACFKQ